MDMTEVDEVQTPADEHFFHLAIICYNSCMPQSTIERTTVTSQSSVSPAPRVKEPGENETKKAIFRTYQIIWYILGVFEVLLGARFLLKALGANPGTPFVQLIYSLSGGLVRPFRGIFGTPVIEGSVLEWISLVAIVVYAVI